MTTPSRLVFFGNERLVSGLPHTNTPVLKGLIERGYDVVAVVSNYEPGTSRNARPLEVAELAIAHNIPILLPKNPQEIFETLSEYHADFAVLAAYGRIIPQRIIDLFNPLGIINIHPSLLPRHRGPTPIETTLLAGDIVAGVSIMQLTAGMDEGPVYGQARVKLTGTETKNELYEQLSKAGSDLLFELLPGITSGTLLPKQQSETDVSYTSLLSKQDGQLDPLTDNAELLERKVRAYQGYPKSHLTLYGNDVVVTSASVAANDADGALVVPCADNTWLEVTSLIGPSGREMDAAAFLRGYTKRSKI